MHHTIHSRPYSLQVEDYVPTQHYIQIPIESFTSLQLSAPLRRNGRIERRLPGTEAPSVERFILLSVWLWKFEVRPLPKHTMDILAIIAFVWPDHYTGIGPLLGGTDPEFWPERGYLRRTQLTTEGWCSR